MAASGEAYTGDRGLRSDGTFDPELPDRPSPAHQWSGAAWTLTAPAPDWDTFRTKMLGDPVYQQIAVGCMANPQGNWLLTTLQDAISMPSPSIALFQPLWNQIIQLSSLQPAAADVTRWQSNADASAVSIKFLANGAIQ